MDLERETSELRERRRNWHGIMQIVPPDALTGEGDQARAQWRVTAEVIPPADAYDSEACTQSTYLGIPL